MLNQNVERLITSGVMPAQGEVKEETQDDTDDMLAMGIADLLD